MRIDYRPGEWLALASPSGLALLEGGADPSLVRSLWSLVSGGGTLGEGLEAVSSRRPGTTLSSLPPFALVFVDDAGAHFACRGPVGIVVELAEAKVCMSGAGVASWREEHTAVPVAVTVTPEAVGRGRRAAKPTEGRTLEL
ncbi:MAG: hypothetical protein LBJ08_09195, partial [Bifidobacteriaceae bacterium]|nr:hypothetical protein [Bifidobacteriaceae bacterium]